MLITAALGIANMPHNALLHKVFAIVHCTLVGAFITLLLDEARIMSSYFKSNFKSNFKRNFKPNYFMLTNISPICLSLMLSNLISDS